MGEQRREFTKEFKREAVRLAHESGRRLADVARELELCPEMIRLWRRTSLRMLRDHRSQSSPWPSYQVAVSWRPSARSTFGLKPRTFCAFSMLKARDLRKKSTRRR